MSSKKTQSTAVLALGALGVVYGDIGTSPIYALKESMHVGGDSKSAIIGVLSLILWTLFAVVSVKYLMFVLRADNRGEGGVLALFALLPGKIRHARKGAYAFIVFLMLIAAAFLFADGLLTPAISVLSAAEGLKSINPDLEGLVLPFTVVILLILFIFQYKGTAKIGAIFGPVMLVWFLAIGGIGVYQILQNTEVLVALNPAYAFEFIFSHGWHTLVVMSCVLLAVTGAEALYADMGHFGKKPIRLGWFGLVGIALVLCYFGQGALVLRDPEMIDNPFFGQITDPIGSIALFALSTIATVIASQALIAGVASIASQAIQLGLLPRMRVQHTSEEHRGQIYVPLVNLLMGAGTIVLVVIFGSSSALAGAYTFAIAGTMLITTIAMIWISLETWKLNKWLAIPLLTVFIVMDLAFLVSTATKIFTGAWLPLVIGFVLASMMWIWLKGRRHLNARLVNQSITWPVVKHYRGEGKVAITDGVGVYLSSLPDVVPQALEAQIRVTHSMPKQIVVVTVESSDEPYSDEAPIIEVRSDFLTVIHLKSGFMETKNIPKALQHKDVAAVFDEHEAIYYVSSRNLLPTRDVGLNRVEEMIFITLHRNSAETGDYYLLPNNRTLTFSVSVEV
jgi:KUP system potassium uptake protein